MKIADYISKSIQEFPSLYKDIDYEKSKLKVLDHIFFTIGNGLELAETEAIEEGGYITRPTYKKDKQTGEWNRLKDKPYGKERYKTIPKYYFESIVYYVHTDFPCIETTIIKHKMWKDSVYFRYGKEIKNTLATPNIYIAESLYDYSPYPFSENSSIACKVFYNNYFLQEDWMNELIILCKRALEYFNDESQYVNNNFYPSEVRVNIDLNYFKEKYDKEGLEGLNRLQKTWSYEIKEAIPDYKEIEIRKTESWKSFRDRQIEFLTSFLKSKNSL